MQRGCLTCLQLIVHLVVKLYQEVLDNCLFFSFLKIQENYMVMTFDDNNMIFIVAACTKRIWNRNITLGKVSILLEAHVSVYL